MIKTSDITKKYAVTRQTINNWIQEGLLERPQKTNIMLGFGKNHQLK